MPKIDISSLDSLEKKFYQLIISRLEGDKISEKEYREKMLGLVRKGLGGFIVFGGKGGEVKDFIGEAQSAAEVPLFIASDIERGVEQQIKGTTPFPCQMAIAAAIDRNRPSDVAMLEDAVHAVAAEAMAVGINMPLIPVLDINLNPDNPIICTRAFSDDPLVVAWFGSQYIRILEGAGLLSCAKHFPGHGDTSVDSHMALPVIGKPEEELMKADVMPFAGAVGSGVSSIMVGHLLIPALDSRPASLSRKIMGGLLRGKLGFGGLILTDALNMNALDAFGNAAVECLRAGADILLHPADAEMAVRGLLKEAASGGLGEEQTAGPLDRIAGAKAKLGKQVGAGVDYHRNRELSLRIIGASLTLVENTAGVLPIAGPGNVRIIFAGDSRHFEDSPFRKHFKYIAQIDDIEEAGQETAVIAVFTSVSAWRGSSGIGDAERERISGLIRRSKHSLVVSFGSPYVLRHFPEADILIAAYEATWQVQEAVIKALRGEAVLRGRLPVTLGTLPGWSAAREADKRRAMAEDGKQGGNFQKEFSKKYCIRFGRIAVDLGFITPDQLKEALSEQVDDNLANNPHRVIGKIFFDRNWMTYQQIEVVLKALFAEEKL